MANSKKLVIAISSPSCGGKTSVISAVTVQRSHILKKVVTSTTRKPRPEVEVDGRDYKFYMEPIFHGKAIIGDFIEHDMAHGNRYGTERVAVEEIINCGLVPIVALTLPGIQCFHDHYPNTFSIYLMPRSIDDVRQRIMDHRMSSDTADMARRVHKADEDMSCWYQYCNVAVVTDHGRLDKTIKDVTHLIDSYIGQHTMTSE